MPRIEVLPPDELPQPVPAPVAAPSAPVERRPDGTVADSEAAKALGARGGLAKARKRAALKGMGLAQLSESDEFHPYWKLSEEWIQERLADLAGQAGGYVGPGPASMVVNAGQLHYAGLYLYDLAMKIGGIASAKIFNDASQLKDKARIQNMAAYEMAVREAKARTASQAAAVNPYAALLASEDDESSD